MYEGKLAIAIFFEDITEATERNLSQIELEQ